jgi:hypothetical protein
MKAIDYLQRSTLYRKLIHGPYASFRGSMPHAYRKRVSPGSVRGAR